MRSAAPAVFFAGLLIGWLTAAALAQEGSDFSGEWRLQEPATTALLPWRMAVEQTLIATTRQGAPMAPFYNTITVRGEYATGTKVSSYGLGLTGGSTSSVSPGSIYTTHYEALWDGDLLIIRTGDHTGPRKETGVWHEQEERWRLISPGLLEIELHARGSEDGSRTEIARYVRQ